MTGKSLPAANVANEAERASRELDTLFKSFNRSDAPGLVVGVSRHGRVVYREAFGLASVQHGVANTPATRMRIGSTTKHFTCLAALLLAEEGKLDLDAACTRYLPELSFTGITPTLRQFMNHTSGMRCSLELAFMANGQAMQPKGWQLQRLTAQQDVNFAPGDGQMYCNGGYHLLSIAIDRAAGMPFEQFLRERVLQPLGMCDTETMPSSFQLVPRVATPHVPAEGGGWRLGYFPTEEVRGEGSLVSTVDDMLRWVAHLNGPKKVGSAETWREILTPPTLRTGQVGIYGLGLYRHLYRGVEVIHHAGGVIGGNSQMVTVPSHGLDIVIMVNGAGCNATSMGWQIVDAMLGTVLEPARSRPALRRYSKMAGTRYHGASGVMIGFDGFEAGGENQLALSFNGSAPLPVLWEDDERVYAGWDDVALGPIEFMRSELAGESDAPATLTYRESGRSEILRRIDHAPADLTSAGRALVGRYRSHDLDADVEIALEGDNLWFTIRGDYSAARRLKLKAWSQDVFEVADPEHTSGALYSLTVERDAETVQRFRIDAVRARHVAFERICGT